MVFRWFSDFLGRWLTMVLKFQGYKKCVNSTRDKMCFRNAGERITALNSFRRAESYERGTDRAMWQCGNVAMWQFPHHSEITSILMPGQHSTAQQYVFSKRLVSTTLSEEQIGFIDFCCKESCLLKAL